MWQSCYVATKAIWPHQILNGEEPPPLSRKFRVVPHIGDLNWAFLVLERIRIEVGRVQQRCQIVSRGSKDGLQFIFTSKSLWKIDFPQIIEKIVIQINVFYSLKLNKYILQPQDPLKIELNIWRRWNCWICSGTLNGFEILLKG